MKTVFTDISTIAHYWANQVQHEAKNPARNFFFVGPTIYSYGYHFPIAKHVTNADGENAVLFTERGYSVTTSKHVRVVAHACGHKNIVYCYSPDSSHSDNFRHWKAEAEAIAARLVKARKPEMYLNDIERIKQRASKYATFFDIALPEDLKQLFSIGNKEEYAQYNKDKAARLEKERIEREKKEKAKVAEELRGWKAGKYHRMYHRHGRDYLRMNTIDERPVVETSQGVVVEIPEAKRLWKALKINQLKVGDKVNHMYEVTHINGDMSVGCHKFPVKYLIEFGNKHLINL